MPAGDAPLAMSGSQRSRTMARYGSSVATSSVSRCSSGRRSAVSKASTSVTSGSSEASERAVIASPLGAKLSEKGERPPPAP
eukprot:1528459-Prymnesium_polylepis.1